MPDLDLLGIMEAELLPVLETVVGKPISQFVMADSQDVEGGVSGADKRICHFHISFADGTTRDTTLFVKRCVWQGRAESVHYRHLEKYGVPAPHLYGVLPRGDEPEIIFLECVTSVSYRRDSEAEWRALLSLMAQFNACPITPEYVEHLETYNQVGKLAEGHWLTGLDAEFAQEEFSTVLQDCQVSAPEIPLLLQKAARVYEQVAAQPQGLLHQDFTPDNFGWRGDRKQAVIFDLPKNARGPRFADVAPYLAPQDWSKGTSSFLEDHRELLIEHYLSEYARFGGEAVSPQIFHEETAALILAHRIGALNYLMHTDQQARCQEILDTLRRS